MGRQSSRGADAGGAVRSAPAGGFGREAEEGPVLVPFQGSVELLEQVGRGDLLFHEATEDDKAACAELAFGRGEA